jgi:glucokinase
LSVIGVDLGGTRIRAGVVESDGRLVARTETLSDPRRGAAAVLDTLRQTITQLAAPLDRLTAIGVACAGQIQAATGVVVQAPNLGWTNVPLAGELRGALRVPVIVENDVRAAAWGEFAAGAGAADGSLVAVFVGTGLGSGAVLDGRLWRGAGNAAGEIGHTQVVHDGLPCPCGTRGCLERYVSGSGFQQRFRDALAAGTPTTLRARTRGGDVERLTAALVYEASEAGDAFAREVWSDAVRYLTGALATYVTLVNPRVLVLGGGVIETVPALFDAVVTRVPPLVTVLAREVLRIERAQLGDWSGVVGAATLARESANRV